MVQESLCAGNRKQEEKMKSTFKNKVIAGCLTGMMVLSMAACGATDEETGLSTKKENTLSQCFSTDMDIVWYQVYGDFGKDADVRAIYVFKDGKLTVYDWFSMGKYPDKLGVYAQMSDKEVVESLEAAKQENDQSIQNRYEESVAFAQETLETIPDNYMIFGYDLIQRNSTQVKDALQAYLRETEEVVIPSMKEAAITYTVVTDNSGNAVQTETINFSANSFLEGGYWYDFNSGIDQIWQWKPIYSETETETMLLEGSLGEEYAKYLSAGGTSDIHDYIADADHDFYSEPDAIISKAMDDENLAEVVKYYLYTLAVKEHTEEISNYISMELWNIGVWRIRKSGESGILFFF